MSKVMARKVTLPRVGQRLGNLRPVSRGVANMKRVVVMTSPVLKKGLKKAKSKLVSLEDCFYDVYMALTKLVNSPSTVMMLMAVAVVAFTHTDDMSDGFLREMVIKHPQNKLLRFVEQNFKQTLGALIFSAVIYGLPRNSNKIAAFIASLFWVFCLPSYNIYQYAAHAILMHCYSRVYLQKSKLLILGAALALALFGHQYLGTFEHPYVRTQAATNTVTTSAPKVARSVVDANTRRE